MPPGPHRHRQLVGSADLLVPDQLAQAPSECPRNRAGRRSPSSCQRADGSVGGLPQEEEAGIGVADSRSRGGRGRRATRASGTDLLGPRSRSGSNRPKLSAGGLHGRPALGIGQNHRRCRSRVGAGQIADHECQATCRRAATTSGVMRRDPHRRDATVWRGAGPGARFRATPRSRPSNAVAGVLEGPLTSREVARIQVVDSPTTARATVR